MKTILYAVFTIVFIWGCTSTTRMIPKTQGQSLASNDTIRIANDSLEYEIIIIDNGFNTWLTSRALPRNHYTQNYLENKNRFWVQEWNNRALQPQRYGDLYMMQIDYLPTVDYGYEVNYLLYNYFVYFQNTFRQKLYGNVPLQ